MGENFVVGQWVTCKGYGVCRVVAVGENGTVKVRRSEQDAQWFVDADVEPFRWQAGRTYNTSLDGVTATIDYETSPDRVVALLSNGGYVSFSGVDGELAPKIINPKFPSHLLPYLSDDTPPVAESDQFRVGQWVRHLSSDKPGVIAWIDGGSVCVRYDNGTAVYEASLVESCATPPVAETATEFSEFDAYELRALEILLAEVSKKRSECEQEVKGWTARVCALVEVEAMIQQAIERDGKCQD